MDRAGEAIDGVVNAGVNSIYDVEYGVADEAALYEQALENAAADAKESAQKMAEAAGRTLGDVISVERAPMAERHWCASRQRTAALPMPPFRRPAT